MKARFPDARVAAAMLATLCLPAPPDVGADEWSLPRELRDEIARLDEAQRRFISSGTALQFMPERQLEHELATRDAAAMSALLEDLMALAEQMAYDPQRDMGSIPLNTAAEEFNWHRVTTPEPLRKLQRSPGPFSVHRYMFPRSGVPTFAGARVAIWPEDLIAGSVDVAIIGVPSDMGSGRRNAEHGPRVMRALDTIGLADVESLIDPIAVLNVVDYGDFAVDYMSAERTVEHVAAMVAEIAATGAIPMLVGGDSSMLYPGVKGVVQAHGRGELGLVHFSAHPDAERLAVHTVSDVQAVFLLLREGLVAGEETVQVGLRGPAADAATLRWLREQGVRYHTMAEVRQRGYDAVLERVLDEVDDGPDRLFVSIDVSVIDPSEMVAAGRIAPDGLRLAQVRSAVRRLCAAKQIVGFEITDMAPMLDHSRLSALNANALLNACLIGLALRRAGLEPGYVHPLALDHGQD